ncbi:MAG: hypothetical protein ABIP34_02445 [Rhodoferax sp.]|uniref:hypothetical protein n=1 Tax=Rhodoferax sp. TaxID=50421 RepID=UPI003263A05A
MRLKNFPIAWRWTDAKYALLPEDILARIEPQMLPVAKKLFHQSVAFNDADGLSERIFSVDQIGTRSTASAYVTNWLLSCHDNKETCVYLSWQSDLAISTTWGIFTHYWEAFCYPASDDLNVWSEAHDWMVFYHHEELMQFGRRLAG